MIFDQYLGRVIILSLDPEGARARHAQAELVARELSEGASVIRAVRGTETPPPPWFRAGAGAWGCLQSHLRAAQAALDSDLPSILLLEDDCSWLPNAGARARTFSPRCRRIGGRFILVVALRPAFPREPIPGKSSCLRARSVHRTHAYAISRGALPRLLQQIQHASDYLIPPAFGSSRRNIWIINWRRRSNEATGPSTCRSYWLAGQAAHYSDVHHRQEPERWWQVPPAQPERCIPLVIADVQPTAAQLERLHFGCNLSSIDPTIDLDVEMITPTDAAELLRTMRIVAEEACTHRRIPAIHCWEDKCQTLQDCWPAGLIRLSEWRDETHGRAFDAIGPDSHSAEGV